MSKGTGSKSRLYAVLAFLIVVSLGEAISLLLEYENNSFLRDYVAQNSGTVGSEAVGIIVLGQDWPIWLEKDRHHRVDGLRVPACFIVSETL